MHKIFFHHRRTSLVPLLTFATLRWYRYPFSSVVAGGTEVKELKTSSKCLFGVWEKQANHEQTMSEAGSTRKRRGAGRATIHDVARLAGVGSITVSRYFSEPGRVAATRSARIAAAVKELGYVPNLVAGGLASSHGRMVGMVIPNISGPIFASTIQSFSDTLTRHGYQLLLASSYFSAKQEESAVRAFLGWKPAALV